MRRRGAGQRTSRRREEEERKRDGQRRRSISGSLSCDDEGGSKIRVCVGKEAGLGMGGGARCVEERRMARGIAVCECCG
eukprot:3709945-Rhodomonas_salina.1